MIDKRISPALLPKEKGLAQIADMLLILNTIQNLSPKRLQRAQIH